MNIALVVEQFDSHHLGGALARRLAGQLVDRGHELTVITGSCRDADDWPGLEIAAMDEKHSRMPWRLPRLVRFARRQLDAGQFDVSLSMTTTVWADVVLPLGESLRDRQPSFAQSLLSRVHPLAAYRRRLEHRTLRDPNVRHLVAPSQYVRDQLRTYHAQAGFDETRIPLIRPGSAITPPTSDQRSLYRRRVRQTFGISQKAVVYVMPESDHSDHGLTTCIKALGAIQDQEFEAMEFVLLLAGAVGFRMNQRLAQTGLRTWVRMVGPTHRMDALYAAGDVTVFPTAYDPDGRSVIDSLRMGVPVITSAQCGASDLLATEEARRPGIVLDEPSNSQSLAHAMIELADPERRRSYAQAAAECGQSLCIDREVDELEQLIRC